MSASPAEQPVMESWNCRNSSSRPANVGKRSCTVAFVQDINDALEALFAKLFGRLKNTPGIGFYPTSDPFTLNWGMVTAKLVGPRKEFPNSPKAKLALTFFQDNDPDLTQAGNTAYRSVVWVTSDGHKWVVVPPGNGSPELKQDELLLAIEKEVLDQVDQPPPHQPDQPSGPY